MEDLEVICPVCSEPNYLPAEDLEELTPDDYFECESCGAYLQILSTDPLEVAVIEDGGGGLFGGCPGWGLSFGGGGGEEGVWPGWGDGCVPDWAGVEQEGGEREYRYLGLW